MTHWEEEDEDFSVPLHHKKAFSAGLRRQKITFVRASSPRPASSKLPEPATVSAEDIYLNLVLPNRKDKHDAEPASAGPPTCDVCSLPVTVDANDDAPGANYESPSDHPHAVIARRHEASLAHQLALAHLHPPSALDRSRIGFAYLASHGWDPDGRVGLGVDGQGIQAPLKPREKRDVLGIGAAAAAATPPRGGGRGGSRVEKQKGNSKRAAGKEATTTTKMDAKRCREWERSERRRTDRIREMFYRSEELDKYCLGLNS